MTDVEGSSWLGLPACNAVGLGPWCCCELRGATGLDRKYEGGYERDDADRAERIPAGDLLAFLLLELGGALEGGHE